MYTEAQMDNLMASPDNGTDGRRAKGKRGATKGPKGPRGGGKRTNNAPVDGASDEEKGQQRTVKPPRKKRRTREEMEAQAMQDDESNFAMPEEDDDIRIVFGGDVSQSPIPPKKKNSRKRDTIVGTSERTAPRVKKVAAKAGAKGRRGSQPQVGGVDDGEGGADLSSAKNLFQQRARARLAEQSTQQNEGENAEEAENHTGRRKKVRSVFAPC